MVRHQAVRQHAHAGNVLQGFGHHTLQGVVIAGFLENRQVAVAPVQDVVNVAPQYEPTRSSHATIVAAAGLSVKIMVADTFCRPEVKTLSCIAVTL